MKKSILSILIIIASQLVTAQIIWDKDKKIKWADFEGEKTSQTGFAAYTSYIINIDYHFNDTCMYYEIQSIFTKEKSWFTDSSKILLEHERGHFDIAEIYSRKIRKYLSTINTKGKTIEMIDNKIDSLLKERDHYQGMYDKQTNYSLNKKMQMQWLKKIQYDLNKLVAFKATLGSVCRHPHQF